MSKKGENIYKRKDGRWEARYVKGVCPNGKTKFGYCYAKSYREAKEKLSRAKIAVQTETSHCTSQKPFSAYCDEWLILCRDRVKLSTYVKYGAVLEKHIQPYFGSWLVSALNSLAVQKFGHMLLTQKKLSAKTVKDILTILNSILKYTAKQTSLSLLNMEIIYPKVPKTEMRVLTKEEQDRFVAYLLKDMDACQFGVLLALFTGMRIGEVCALRWENISLAEKTIRIDATMQRLKKASGEERAKTEIVISDPKSNFSLRVIPMTEQLCRLCQMRYNPNPRAYVLTGKENHFLEPRALQYRLQQYTKHCHLSGVHFHTLRHTFATRCVEVDFEIKSLSEILGHASPRITLERYVHSSMELKRSNMNKLESIGF